MRFKQTITLKQPMPNVGMVSAVLVFHATNWEAASSMGSAFEQSFGFPGPTQSIITYDDDNAEEEAARERRRVLIEKGIPPHDARKMDEFEQALKRAKEARDKAVTTGEPAIVEVGFDTVKEVNPYPTSDAREYVVYRDTPKRGETDAKWCGYYKINGHTFGHATGFETQALAEAHFKGEK